MNYRLEDSVPVHGTRILEIQKMGLTKRLLFIVPEQPASSVPVLDDITRKMCAAFRKARPSDYAYGGFHECYCGAASSSCDYILPSGHVTNSLCMHYLAYHRADIVETQLDTVKPFTCGETGPSERELLGPEYLLSCVRAMVERKLGPGRLQTFCEWGLDVAALSEALRGGSLQSPKIFTPTRWEAQDLFDLLCVIPIEVLPFVRTSILRAHGDFAAWSADALRSSGWRRAAWIAPMADILQLPDEVIPDKRLIKFSYEKLISQVGG